MYFYTSTMKKSPNFNMHALFKKRIEEENRIKKIKGRFSIDVHLVGGHRDFIVNLAN